MPKQSPTPSAWATDAHPDKIPPPSLLGYLGSLIFMLLVSNAVAFLVFLVIGHPNRQGKTVYAAPLSLAGYRIEDANGYNPWVLTVLMALATLWTVYQWIAGLIEERRTRQRLNHHGQAVPAAEAEDALK